MSSIALQHVWKTYQMGAAAVDVLKDVTLTITPGEWIAIMGPSGSGKSTCMNVLGCLDRPSQGKIFLDTKNIAHLNETELARVRSKKIGFVFQQFHLIKTLNALENVMLPLMFQRTPERERRQRAKELLDRVGLQHRLSHKPNQLSGGEQQRVAIARALANNPEIILADEPTGNLDSETGKKVLGLLSELHREGKTIVVVTHDKEVAKYAQRIYAFKDGRMVKNYAA